VQALDDARELLEDAPGLVEREDAVGRRGDELLERDRRAQALLDEVEVAGRADRLEDLDEVAVREELCEDGGLSQEAGRDELVVRVERRVLERVLRARQPCQRSSFGAVECRGERGRTSVLPLRTRRTSLNLPLPSVTRSEPPSSSGLGDSRSASDDGPPRKDERDGEYGLT